MLIIRTNEQNPVTTGRIATWASEQLVQALAERGHGRRPTPR